MPRLYRFIILALVGFAIGGGIAYMQARHAAAPSQVDVSQAASQSTDQPASGALPTHDHAAHMQQAQERAAAAPSPLAGSGLDGGFDLVDHNGQAVTHESWPGKYKLVFFGFTHCPDICPAALDRITSALSLLGADAAALQPLFITVDPARDTPETLREYLSEDYPGVLGLTGSEAQVKQAENAYKVYAARVETGTEVYTMAHSSFVFLMSPEDQLLEVFRDSDPAEEMAARIRARLP